MSKSHLFKRFKIKLVVLLLGVLSLNSCGTLDSSSTNPVSRQTRRQTVINDYIQNLYQGKKEYVNIDFGDEYIVKPESFRTLDSLYAVQYEESNFGGISRSRKAILDAKIDSLLPIVMPDTVLMKYEIAHVFALEEGDSADFISSKFLLNAEDSVESVGIEFQFSDKKNLLPYLVEFMKSQSFIYAQYDVSTEEKDFYKFFEDELGTIDGAVRKGDFIDHTLHVMAAANVQGSLSTELIVKQLVLDNITEYVKSYKSIAWSDVFSNLDSANHVLGYSVQHQWSYEGNDGQEYKLMREFDLNTYFQITQISEIDSIRTTH